MMFPRAVFYVALMAGPALAAGPPPPRLPEGVRKVIDVLTNPNVMGMAEDLYVSKSRLDWEWLARRHGVKPDGAVTRKAFKGPPELFKILDRDGDGAIRADDFDWSDAAPWVRQRALATSLFRRLNSAGDGRLSAEEWKAAFGRMAGGKDHLTPEDLRRALFPPPAGMPPGMVRPTRFTRLMGLLTGELGSLSEGAALNEPAPDFVLSTPDGKEKIRLSSFKGKKPVVLIFGNFT